MQNEVLIHFCLLSRYYQLLVSFNKRLNAVDSDITSKNHQFQTSHMLRLIAGRLLQSMRRQLLRWLVSRTLRWWNLQWKVHLWDFLFFGKTFHYSSLLCHDVRNNLYLPLSCPQRMSSATVWAPRRLCMLWQWRRKPPWVIWTLWSVHCLTCSGVTRTWRAPWRALRK